jgi:iron complex outermembrane receptor protein
MSVQTRAAGTHRAPRHGAGRAFRLALLSTVPALLLAAHAYAADAVTSSTSDASAGGSTTVQDVIVTATRQETKVQTTAVAVTVVGADKVATQNLITARDLAGQVPGVEILRGGITPTTQTFFIRGIGNPDPIFDPNVAQYIDDVYLPRAINGMASLPDIERVEVLRGPQGTLFGENADAGAIRYITRNPTDHPELNADVGYGTYNAFNFHGYVAGPIVPGRLDGNIAFGHEQHDGYTYDPTIKQSVNNLNTSAARAKLLATLSPKLTVLLAIDGSRDTSDTGYYIPVHPIVGGTLQSPVYGPFNPNESLSSQTPTNNSWTGGVSVKVSFAFNPELTFNAISAFRAFAQDPVNYNNDGEPLVAYNNANPVLTSISDNYIVYREKEATQEFQLLGKYDRFDFASGLYFLYEDFSSNRIGYVASSLGAGAGPVNPFDQIGDTKTYNYAAYVQGDYHVTSDLTATLGGRYTIEHRDFNFQGLYDTFTGTALPRTTAGDFTYQDGKTWSSFSPKGSVSYQFTPGAFGYVSVSEGFDAGGFNNRAASLATALPYNQENVTTYEVGLKTDWLEHRLRLNGTVFYNAYTGLQETASVPNGNILVSARANANRAHTEGVEFESVATPIDGLTLNGNVSYLQTQFDSFPNAGARGTALNSPLVSATGNQLPISPHWQLFAAASYRLPLNLPGDLKIGADITYETAYFTDVLNQPQGEISPQGFVDAFVSYAPANSPWQFSITGHNLADRIAYQTLSYATPNLWEGPVSPPRTVFFKISYKR